MADTTSRMHDRPLNILLVEDNPGDARLLSENLTEEAGDTFHLNWVQDLTTALKKVSVELVDAVLLDLNLPDSEGFDTFTRMRAAAADTPILVLTGLEDDQIGLKAIQQGAQDYLNKSDLTGGAIARALRYAVERNRSRLREFRQTETSPPGKVIGFVGAKGGVGTTTVVLNIAALLAKKSDGSVTAAELRGDYGAFAARLRESPVRNLSTLLKLDLSTLANSVLEKCLFRSPLGFDILFSPQRPSEFSELDSEAARFFVDRLARRSRYTLVDLPDLYSPATAAAIEGCHLLVLVTERDPSSVAGAGVALRFLATRQGKTPPVGLIVVNRALMIEGATPKRIESDLGCSVIGVVPPAPEVSVGAQRSGTPIALHRPLSAPAAVLNTIAGKIERAVADPKPAPRLLEQLSA